MSSLVIVNALTIGIAADAPEGWSGEGFIAFLEILLITIFTTELALRMFGLGSAFWEDSWNWLDFFVISASIIEPIIASASGTEGGFLSQFRLLRVLRVVRLVGMFEKLANLVEAFWEALKCAAWVGILCFVIFYVFAVMAKSLFHNDEKLRASPDYQEEWFRNIPCSLLSLFQLMTMDGVHTNVAVPSTHLLAGTQTGPT